MTVSKLPLLEGPMLRFIAIILAIPLTAGIAGCRQDMQDQPKMVPLRGSAFFPDGRSARYQLAGTVARGQEQSGTYFLTGMSEGKEGEGLPFPVTMRVLERGQERFNIYCSPCHSRVGNGQGRIVERGYYQAADFHSERLREAPAGHFFQVMTKGYGAMPDYHVELSPADRWAVVAYIRALQLSQNAKTSDAAPGARIASLAQIANEEGLSPEFAAEDWTHPVTPAPVPSSQVAAQPAVPPSNLNASLSSPGPQPQEAESGSKSQQKPTESPEAQAGDHPPAATAETTTGDPVAGKQLYTDNCQVCHQATRQGLPPMIPSLVGIVAKVGAAHIRQTVINGVPTGKPPMPSFGSKFSATDIDNLIAFLNTKP